MIVFAACSAVPGLAWRRFVAGMRAALWYGAGVVCIASCWPVSWRIDCSKRFWFGAGWGHRNFLLAIADGGKPSGVSGDSFHECIGFGGFVLEAERSEGVEQKLGEIAVGNCVLAGDAFIGELADDIAEKAIDGVGVTEMIDCRKQIVGGRV